MSKNYAQFLTNAQNEIAVFCENLDQKRQIFFDKLNKEADELDKAIEKYIKTRKYDSKIFGEFKKVDGINEEKPAVQKKRGRRPSALTEINEEIPKIRIKKEKISEVHSITSSTLSSTSVTSVKENVPIKSEGEEMPAPSWIPPKKKAKETEKPSKSVRITRTKGRKATMEMGTDRLSDVVIQNANISTISLSDTEDSEEGVNKPVKPKETTRSTRTKTRQKQISEKERERVTSEAAETTTRSTRTKTIRKEINKEELEEPSSRSTRTKTLKNADKETNSNKKQPKEQIEDTEEIIQKSRSTRTKTVRKDTKEQKSEIAEQNDTECEEIVQESRSTRTKTVKNDTKEQKSDKTEQDDTESEETVQESKSTKTRTVKKDTKERESAKAEQSDLESINASKSKTKRTSKFQEPSPDKLTKTKRNRSDSMDEEVPKTERKKSKSNSPQKEKDLNNITGLTEYEDARSTMGLQIANPPLLNSTYIADIPTQPKALNTTQVLEPAPASNIANCTVVLEKPELVPEMIPSLTDDESIELKTPPKKQPKSKVTKEVFSPYEKTSTKKKVEAFEKLQQTSKATGSASTSKIKDPGSAVKQKTKYFTPVESKIFNPTTSSTSKISRLISHTNESLSQLRTTQKESREKQKKLLEREQAKIKKEAMLQAMAESKKKLNDEKQLKALQQRKVLEAEKQKLLEKDKEERLKQREQEREEYLQKQKMDLEKKRLAQKKKMQEMQLQKQNEEHTKQAPVYMTSRPPLLPTKDCYDSDDPDYQKQALPPSWCTGERLKIKQLTMMTAGEKIKNTLFCRHAQTPDLTEIFQVIDPKKLKRNSSVIWRQPPRYTMMPDLNETRFSDDDDA